MGQPRRNHIWWERGTGGWKGGEPELSLGTAGGGDSLTGAGGGCTGGGGRREGGGGALRLGKANGVTPPNWV